MFKLLKKVWLKMQNGLNATNGLSGDFATIPDSSIDPQNNRVIPRQVATGMTRGVQQLGSESVYSDGGNNRIVVADTVPRVIMGNQPTFGKGFFVSKEGIDATTNTDPNNWIFNSTQNIFKIVSSGVATLNIPSPLNNGVKASVTIAHGLSTAPGLKAYLNGTGSAAYLALGTNYLLPYVDGFAGLAFSATTDATNATFYVYNNTGGAISGLGTVTFKYYLEQETAV